MANKEDFVGFTFDGKHSSDLGIMRTSDGDRFNLDLFPASQDKVVQVPGADGNYYFGSTYTQREITIPIAFDNLSEQQFQQLRKVFGSKDPKSLIFDETPYKEYIVKGSGISSLKYICFEEPNSPVYNNLLHNTQNMVISHDIDNNPDISFLERSKGVWYSGSHGDGWVYTTVSPLSISSCPYLTSGVTFYNHTEGNRDIIQRISPLTIGEKYTISFYFNGNATILVRLSNHYIDPQKPDIVESQRIELVNTALNTDIGLDFQYFHYTFDFTQEKVEQLCGGQKNLPLNLAFQIGISGSTPSGQHIFAGIKLEEGNNSHPMWTPAIDEPSNIPTLSNQIREEPPTRRIYKGEGTLNFVSYEPYARSVSRFYTYYKQKETDYPTLTEWAPNLGKGILEDGVNTNNTAGVMYKNDPNATQALNETGEDKGKRYIYKEHPAVFSCPNYGDMETDWEIIMTVGPMPGSNGASHDTNRVLKNLKVELYQKDKVISTLVIDGLKLSSNDSNIRINSETNLVEGRSGTNVTGRIYNQYANGTFFKIPVNAKGEYTIRLSSENTQSDCWYVEVLKYYYRYY